MASLTAGKATNLETTLLNSIPPHLLPRYDPTFVEYYNKNNAGRLATHQIPIEEYRRDPAKYTIAYGRQAVSGEGLLISEQQCPVEGGSITVRIIRQDPAVAGERCRPVYINFHGGGWVFGDLRNDFDWCKRVVHELDVVAFDVDYRLAPEFKFPTPVNDCWDAFNWISEFKQSEFNLDLAKVAVGGCSAGGHLAAVVAHMCRDYGIPLCFQLLTVPVTDLHVFTPEGELREDCPYESYRELYEGVPLSGERMKYFHKQFLGSPRPKELDNDWRVSPILAPNFEGLALALVIIGEMDLLRDEGEAYAEKMNKAGSTAEVIRFKGAPHSFPAQDDILEIGQGFNREALRAMKASFSRW